MKIYVIHLARARERRKLMQEQLNRLNLPYEMLPAVDYLDEANDISSRLRELHAEHPQKTNVTAGMYACALSHRKVYAKILSDGTEGALVLEDDAVLPSNLLEILDDVNRAATGNDFIMLSYYNHDNSPIILKRSEKKEAGSSQFFRPVEMDKIASGLAYVISKAAARSMLEQVQLITTGDSWGEAKRSGWTADIYCRYPQVVFPAPVVSRINYGGARLQRVRAKAWRSFPMVERLTYNMRYRRILRNSKFKAVFVD